MNRSQWITWGAAGLAVAPGCALSSATTSTPARPTTGDGATPAWTTGLLGVPVLLAAGDVSIGRLEGSVLGNVILRDISVREGDAVGRGIQEAQLLGLRRIALP